LRVSDIVEFIVQISLVGREVKVAVTAEVKQDYPFITFFSGLFGFYYCCMDSMGRFRSREDTFVSEIGRASCRERV